MTLDAGSWRDLSEQAEFMARRILGTDFGKVKKATL